MATALSSAMNGLISEELVQMVGHVASAAVVAGTARPTRSPMRSSSVSTPRSSTSCGRSRPVARFSEAERAALRLAFHAGQHPNGVTDTDIEDCRAYFSEDQITAIVAVCALCGFLNRWNDTMATTLEAEAHVAATRRLAGRGWTAGKHATRGEGPR